MLSKSVWLRGLKLVNVAMGVITLLSKSVWLRGLKYQKSPNTRGIRAVEVCVASWIEIRELAHCEGYNGVEVCVASWIEILKLISPLRTNLRRSLCGFVD